MIARQIWSQSLYSVVSQRLKYWRNYAIFTRQHATHFNGPFSGTTQVSRYQKGKTNLDFTEARGSRLLTWSAADNWSLTMTPRMQMLRVAVASAGSYADLQSAPRSMQITTPAPHHSDFYRPDTLPAAQPTASKHWRLKFSHAKFYCSRCLHVHA